MAYLSESRFRGLVHGLIESGASVRASTSELWAEIRGAVNELGESMPPNAGQIVGELRSAAVSRRIGAETFQAADRAAEFTRDMAAPDSNVRPLGARVSSPEFLVRFDLTYVNPSGDVQTRTVSVRDIWRPDMTVGDVYDSVQEAAEGLAQDYGQGLVSFGNLRPVTI